MEHIGHTLLILEPLEHGIPLTRAWCIWEIFCTIRAMQKGGKCRLTVAMPPNEQAKFERMLVQDFEEVIYCLTRVQAQESEAFLASDRDVIFRTIREQCEGVVRIRL